MRLVEVELTPDLDKIAGQAFQTIIDNLKSPSGITNTAYLSTVLAALVAKGSIQVQQQSSKRNAEAFEEDIHAFASSIRNTYMSRREQ